MITPGEQFTAKGAAPSVLAGLRTRLVGAWGAIMLCLVAGLGLLVPGLVVPAAVRIFVNQYLGAGQTHWLSVLAVAVGAAAIAQVALTWLQQITLLRLSTKLAVSMSTRFFEHLLRLPIAFFGQRYAGLLVTRVQVNDELRQPPLQPACGGIAGIGDGGAVPGSDRRLFVVAGAGHDRLLVGEPDRAALRRPLSARCQPAPRPGPGQADWHRGVRHGRHRDPEGHQPGRHVLRAVRRPAGQGDQLGADPGGAQRGPLQPADAARRAQQRGRARGGSVAGDGRDALTSARSRPSRSW